MFIPPILKKELIVTVKPCHHTSLPAEPWVVNGCRMASGLGLVVSESGIPMFPSMVFSETAPQSKYPFGITRNL